MPGTRHVPANICTLSLLEVIGLAADPHPYCFANIEEKNIAAIQRAASTRHLSQLHVCTFAFQPVEARIRFASLDMLEPGYTTTLKNLCMVSEVREEKLRLLALHLTMLHRGSS